MPFVTIRIQNTTGEGGWLFPHTATPALARPARGGAAYPTMLQQRAMLDRDWLLARLALLVPLVLSLTVHEWAHAFSAYRLGDDTAKRQGRLTLDPLRHIDPIGTILLPLLGIPFGWAKPVPVNPLRFRRGVPVRSGMILTAAAGPLSNVVLALIVALLYGLLLRFGATFVPVAAAELLLAIIMVNVALAVFNMLPIPPLDGGRVVDGLVPARYAKYWEAYCRYSPFILLAVILSPSVFHVSMLGWPIEQVHRIVFWLVRTVAGAGGQALAEQQVPLVTATSHAALALAGLAGTCRPRR